MSRVSAAETLPGPRCRGSAACVASVIALVASSARAQEIAEAESLQTPVGDEVPLTFDVSREPPEVSPAQVEIRLRSVRTANTTAASMSRNPKTAPPGGSELAT